MLIKIAWRNVWRNKTRSLVIIIAVSLGLWGGIFSDAFMKGMSEQQIRSTIQTETGHIQINDPGFLVNYDMQLNIKNVDAIIRKITAIAGVKAVASKIQMSAMASTSSSSAGVMLNGIDPISQAKVSNLYQYIVDGDYFKGSEKHPIVISKALADKLHLKIHSRIVFTLQTLAGDITYASFKVIGIFHTHDTEFDKGNVYVQAKDLTALINYPANTASTITILLNKKDDSKPITNTIKTYFPDLQIQTWQELSPMMQMLESTMDEMSMIFVGVILIALAFGIINTMLMAVLDRTREIGMLLSIGMRPQKVFIMIVLETIFLSFTGAGIGVLLSIFSIQYFGSVGINLSIISEGINALGYSSVVYPEIGISFYIKLVIITLIISFLSGLFPARRAIKLRPADAMRME